MQKLCWWLMCWIWSKRKPLIKRAFLKHIVGDFYNRRYSDETNIYKMRERLLQQYKNQEVKKIRELFHYRQHAKVRIAERFGSLTRQQIVDDIVDNNRFIIPNKDGSFKIVTKENSYVFSKHRHLITTYPNNKNLYIHQ